MLITQKSITLTPLITKINYSDPVDYCSLEKFYYSLPYSHKPCFWIDDSNAKPYAFKYK